MVIKEYETHSVDKKTGVCYVKKRTEEYKGRCLKHSPLEEKKEFVKMNGDNLPVLPDDEE